MECARCHDHKFDPLTQKDYYSFFAFFNSVPEYGEDGRVANAVPFISAPTIEQQAELKRLRREIDGLDQKLDEYRRRFEQSASTSEIQRLATLEPSSTGSNDSSSIGEAAADESFEPADPPLLYLDCETTEHDATNEGWKLVDPIGSIPGIRGQAWESTKSKTTFAELDLKKFPPPKLRTFAIWIRPDRSNASDVPFDFKCELRR
jgi:hypothetical protein